MRCIDCESCPKTGKWCDQRKISCGSFNYWRRCEFYSIKGTMKGNTRTTTETDSLISLIDTANDRNELSEKRFRQKFDGQSNIAKKVYECIPIASSWTLSQICTEMARKGQGNDHRITQGCVNTLVNSGLVKESPRGTFRRLSIKQQKKEVTEPALLKPIETRKEMTVEMKFPAKKEKDPLEMLSSISSSARKLADDLDDAALVIASQIRDIESQSSKLKQLQALLKSIGAE